MRRLSQFVVLMALSAASAAGYYHFLHYPSRLGPYTPIYEKFDLNALVNKTVYFYVSEDRPALAPSDSYESLIAHVRQGLAAWNNIPTSDLRVVFGGFTNLSASQPETPSGEIVFEELPPGVLGLGGPMTRLPQTGGFIPIVRSRLILPRDLSNPNRTTASESFFNSLVHEIGHALGLQHSLTGAAMSVEVTRSTTRARPLAADDVAGLSLLYPAPGLAASSGTITGRVITPSGRELHMVSVVAVSPSGAVISALTLPDGSYRIEGIPPGTYFVYAHPLPPATQAGLGPANIVLPTDGAGAVFEAAGPVETQFFGGSKDPNTSIPVQVNAGLSSDGVDFRLAERASLLVYDVTTYSFPGNSAPAILPAFLNISRGSGTVLAFGPGLSANLRNTSVGVLAGGVQVRSGSPAPYGPDPRFAEIQLEFNPVTGTGSRHLVFSLNGDVYVRPGGVQLVTRPAPLVRDVQIETDAAGQVTLVLSGDGLAADSRVYLDGAPAAVRSFDEIAGRLRVSPPPGPGGRQAIISVHNPDGQSSVFVQPTSPATYTYPPSDAPAISVTPSSGRAGRDVMVEIQGTNTSFVDGQTVVGFGTPDVVTRQVWVLSPTRLLAVVSISPRAALAAGTVSVATGLRLVTLPFGFRVEAAAPPSATTPVVSFQGLVNSATSRPRVAPGALASLFGTNLSLGAPANAGAPLPTTLAGTTVTLNDVPAPLLAVRSTQINLQLPFNLPAGPVVLRVNNGVETSAPMVVQIDPVAPGLFRVLNSAGAPVDLTNPVRLGDTLVLLATGLGPVTPPVTAGAPAPLASATSSVRVVLAGMELAPSFAGLAPGTTGVYQVNVPVPLSLPLTPTAQIHLSVDGQASNALTIGLRLP